MKGSNVTMQGRRRETSEAYYLKADEISLVFPSAGNRLGDALTKKNRAHIDDLKQSMRDRGFLVEKAIVIKASGEIVSGHHRYEAAKELGIGIWVIVKDDASLADMAIVDGINKKWTTMDWITKHAAEGVGDFPKVFSFFRQTGVKLNVGLMLLLGNSSTPAKTVHSAIANGQLKVKDFDKAWKRFNALGEVTRAAFPRRPDLYLGDHIWSSAILSCMLNVPGYENDKMAERASRQTERIRPQRNRKETLRMLQDVYNYGVAQSRHIKIA